MIDFNKLLKDEAKAEEEPITLTPEQQAFCDEVSQTSTSIRLDAVAGSGKTFSLVRAAQLIPQSEATIALAFNKKIQLVLADVFPSHIECKTFNGLGSMVWSRAKGRIKLNPRKIGALTSDYCRINDMGDDWASIRALTTQLKSSGIIHPAVLEKAINNDNEIDYDGIAELAEYHDIQCNKFIAEAALTILLESTKEAMGQCIDFDDQIYMSTYFAPDRVWPKYDNILVDESQDLSEMQHDFLERLMHDDTRLIIVGDPHQAIYGWRGASSASMDILQERFGLKCMPLSVCFRCPPEIVALAQESVPHIKPWEGKASGIVSYPEEWESSDLKKGSVVLCRNNAPLVALAFRLLEDDIPAYFAGRNLAAGLKKVVDKVGEGSLANALAEWRDSNVDTALANKKYDIADKIEDQYDVLECIRCGRKYENKYELKSGIDYLFRKEYSPDAIELSTIHRSKGKEWDTVYFLNSELIPGRWVSKALEEGKSCGPWMMEQEENLRYVCVTRSLNELIYITQERAA